MEFHLEGALSTHIMSSVGFLSFLHQRNEYDDNAIVCAHCTTAPDKRNQKRIMKAMCV